MASSKEGARFPNKSPEYRLSRDVLPEAEVELRRALEDVAALPHPAAGRQGQGRLRLRGCWIRRQDKAFRAVQTGEGLACCLQYDVSPLVRG